MYRYILDATGLREGLSSLHTTNMDSNASFDTDKVENVYLKHIMNHSFQISSHLDVEATKFRLE